MRVTHFTTSKRWVASLLVGATTISASATAAEHHRTSRLDVRGDFTQESTGSCANPLPACPADVAGADGQVNVNDLLAVINTWGQTGPPRPQADCAPLPNGDCTVNVNDLLGVINTWGLCPVVVQTRACCLPGSACQNLSQDACATAGGVWLSQGTICGFVSCPEIPPAPICLIRDITHATIFEESFYVSPVPTFTNPGCSDEVTWVLETGPVGMTIDSANGVVTWSNALSGSHEVIIRATTPTGGDDEGWWIAVKAHGCNGCAFEATCQGDANGDDGVDQQDMDIVMAAYGTSIGHPNYNGCADFNCDGIIDNGDLGAVQATFGLDCNGVEITPSWPPAHYEAQLSRSDVVPAPAPPPPSAAAALGNAALHLRPIGGGNYELYCRVRYRGLTGVPSSIRLHRGQPGQSGPVLAVVCTGGACGTAFNGEATVNLPLSASLQNDLIANNVYVVVASAMYPAGEIRGQVTHDFFDVMHQLTYVSPQGIAWAHDFQNHEELLLERLSESWRQRNEIAALMDGLHALALLYSQRLSGLPEEPIMRPYFDAHVQMLSQGKESVKANLRSYGAQQAGVSYQSVNDAYFRISAQRIAALTDLTLTDVQMLWSQIPSQDRLTQFGADCPAGQGCFTVVVNGMPMSNFSAPTVAWLNSAATSFSNYTFACVNTAKLKKLWKLIWKYGKAIWDAYSKHFPDWDKIENNLVNKGGLDPDVVKRILKAILDP